MFSLIAAVGKNNELGIRGELVFHLKEDMKFFRETTKGHPVIMGRKTWDSLPGKLPGRKNIVISTHDFAGPDEIVHDIDAYISASQDSDEEVFVIGGGSVYKMFLPHAKTIYLTEINKEAKADVFFPKFDKKDYKKSVIKKGTENGIEYSIVKYTKNHAAKHENSNN